MNQDYIQGQLFSAANPEIAAVYFERARKEEPHNIYISHAAIANYMRLRDFEKARLVAESALMIDPGDEYSRILLAGFLLEAGNIDEARQLLAAYSEKSDASSHMLSTLAVVEYKAGHTNAAIQYLDRCIAQEPRFAKCYLRRGLATRRLTGQATTALPYVEQAVALDPSNPEAHFELGWMLADLNRIPEACRALLRAKALGQRDSQGLTPSNCAENVQRMRATDT
jgi:tetratricopeptide (TPR) repeat protein